MIFKWVLVLLFTIAYLIILLMTEYLYQRYKISSEYTRKTGHILASLSSILFVLVFDSISHVIAIGFIAFLILYISKRKKVFKSINGIDRKSAGSYLLPISITLVFIVSHQLSEPILFVLPILTLGISDPLAAIIGVQFAHKSKNIIVLSYDTNKTQIGTLTFLISSFLISYACLYYYDYSIFDIILISFTLAIFNTFTELISPRGIDNITIPIMSLLVLLSFIL